MIRQCVILAGGNGTRLQPLWDGPKTLVPVKGKPFALYQLEWLARQGVWEVVYCAGQHTDALKEALGTAQLGMRLTYLGEPKGTGTAGALRVAHDSDALAEEFFVLYGDSYLRAELEQCECSPWSITMTLVEHGGVLGRGNVDMWEWKVRAFDELQPRRFMDYGLWCMRRDVAGGFHPRQSLRDAVQTYVHQELLHAHVLEHRFYEVGTPQGVAELESFLDLQ